MLTRRGADLVQGTRQRLLFITARLEHENELNIHEHAVFVNKEPGQLHYGELNTT